MRELIDLDAEILARQETLKGIANDIATGDEIVSFVHPHQLLTVFEMLLVSIE